MRALCIRRPGEIALIDVDRPRPKGEEVLVRVGAAGICGSDLELLRGTRPQAYCRYPIIPGHEWAGEVADGGDPVVAEGFRSCGECDRCQEGHSNLCTAAYAETGFTHSGGFAEYLCLPARLVHRLPAGTDLGAAALIEPAACVAEGLLQVDVRPGLDVAIVGAGTLGLLAVMLLRQMDPGRLVLVGTNRKRLDLGTQVGASETVESVERLGSQFDLVFEATNRPGGAQTVLDLARRGGTVILEGINGGSQPSVISDSFALKQLRVHGVFGASSKAWRWAIDMFTRHQLPFQRLITHRFRLDDYALAFATVEDRASGAVKVQFDLS
jgi:threonine dehydrogenase-like Zn-dependent dehydrogenase